MKQYGHGHVDLADGEQIEKLRRGQTHRAQHQKIKQIPDGNFQQRPVPNYQPQQQRLTNDKPVRNWINWNVVMPPLNKNLADDPDAAHNTAARITNK